MKLFSKFFFPLALIVCLALSLSGYLLLSSAFKDSIQRETEKAVSSYQVTRYVIHSALTGIDKDILLSKQLFIELIPDVIHSNDPNNKIAVFNAEREPIYSEFPGEYDPKLLYSADEKELIHKVHQDNAKYYLTVAGRMERNGETLYLTVSTDITELLRQQKQREVNYRMVYGVVSAASVIAIAMLSMLLIRPVRKLSLSASKIASGNYGTRADVRTRDEIGELASSFNAMAGAVEDNMEELKRSVLEKEDFVANFAHELKTPLTSVIGYADMLYHKKLTPEQVKEAAGYILEEGLRLESLSYKLMELVVLHRQDFVFEELSAKEVFASICETVTPMLKDREIVLEMDVENTVIAVEFDLFKTMVLNIIDNAAKADAHHLVLQAQTEETMFVITLRDDGCGMPQEVLQRITEAFYMVDKSRSRKQHGAGIGLALVERIAGLHGGTLEFQSQEKKGTTVIIRIPCRREDVS